MAKAQEILIVDDISSNREILQQTLELQGYDIIAVPSGEVGLDIVTQTRPDLILLDIIMPAGIDGFETCRRLKANPATNDIPVIFITARDDEAAIEEGFRVGAVDYITKPFRDMEVRLRVETHLKIGQLTQSLQQQNLELKAEIERRHLAENERNAAVNARQRLDGTLQLLSAQEAERWGIEGFVGQSPTIASIIDEVRRLQEVGSPNVLITGESGTGKELIARALHYGGSRSQGPFVAINSSSFSGGLAESTFFGHVKGAFTGAHEDRQGCFELASGGTLFLDEIGDMKPDLQASLLRVLEERKITRIGSNQPRPIDVRILSATNANFREKMTSGAFREDLYFRIAGYIVEAPPLRERQEDIPLLACHFLDTFAREMGRQHAALTQEALDRLQSYHFPGNIRELKNIIERALIKSGSSTIASSHLHFIEWSAEEPLEEPSSPVPAPVLQVPRRPPREEESILAYVELNCSITNAECRDLLNVDRHRAFYLLEKLRQEQRLVRQGARRATRYYPPSQDLA